ncbi:MAG: DinB family protein [Pirellulales bacterium]|nr:DinB family protein [Pirellulales bacterium]
MHYRDLIDQYLSGSDLAARSVTGLTSEQLDAKPIVGQWSIRQVVCHVADFEPIYVDRMKRVIAEYCPTFFGGNPDTFAAGLAYTRRKINIELEMITAVRRHMAAILRELSSDDFQRIGNHSASGPLSLEQLLVDITAHIPHHVRFIEAKRAALGV